jgi:hypothetical protein
VEHLRGVRRLRATRRIKHQITNRTYLEEVESE